MTVEIELPCGHDYVISREKEPMTIVCALWDGESLYLAADSKIGGLPTKALAMSKLDSLDSPFLAWGTAGDEAIGDLWGAWFKRYVGQLPHEQRNWDHVIQMGRKALAEYNGNLGESKQRARIVLNPENDYGQILLVGFLDGFPEIVHLSVAGDFDMHIAAGRSFACMGAGRDMAAAIYALLNERDLLPAESEAAIREITTFVARIHPGCELPITVIRLSLEN